MKENQQPITGCGAGDIAPYAFLCGDPARIPKVSALFDDFTEVCRVREYVIHTGTVQGFPMTVASTGIGGPSTAVVLEEMAKLGAHTFIRIGNSGAVAEEVALGDYVITTGSIRDEGTSKSYVRTDYPAVADWYQRWRRRPAFQEAIGDYEPLLLRVALQARATWLALRGRSPAAWPLSDGLRPTEGAG